MFDPWDRLPDVDFQTSLFADEAVAASTLAPERRELTNGAWVDVQRDWLPDPDAVFTALVERVPWHAERREMYDSVVVVPRLLHTYLADEPLPHPALEQARQDTIRYANEARETLTPLPDCAAKAALSQLCDAVVHRAA